MNPSINNAEDSLPTPVSGQPVGNQPAGAQPPANDITAPPSNMPAMPSSTTMADTATPAVADDADLIEKEWVNKAKEIVAQTKDNPSQQSAAINRFKADYLRKRYNKELKVSES